MKRTADSLMLSDSVRRLNPTLANPPKPLFMPEKMPHDETAQRKSLNKTEERFRRDCLASIAMAGGHIIAQPSRLLHLAGGGTYTPDFLTISADGVDVWEVKGGYRGPGWEQGYERYKRTAFEWHRPWFRFHLAEFRKGKWIIKDWMT